MEVSRRLWAVTAALAASIFALSPATAKLGDGPGCQREQIASGPSSDRWTIVTQEEVCSDRAFVTTVVIVVQLVRTGQTPSDTDDLAYIEYNGDAKSRPVARWLSEHELQIIVRSRVGVTIKRQTFEGVTISVAPASAE